MFTVTSQKKIARKHNVPDVVMNSIFRDVETEVDGMIVERGFLREMRESLNHLKTWFDAQELVTEDKLGDKTITALCIVKNLHNLVEALIARHKIRRPRVNNNCLSHTHLQFCVITVLHCRIVIFMQVVLGCDGGNHKLLVTLAVFDLDNPELEVNGFMSGGTRRSLIIAAADKVSIVQLCCL